jgi:uncharacterized repeat protein (TIGR01451 family)
MNAKFFGGCLAAALLVGHAASAQAQTADLSITMTVTTPEIPPEAGANPGANVVYSIQVQNIGPNTASNVSVVPTPSPGLSFVSNAGDCTGAFPCSLGTMTSGQSKTITSTWLLAANYTPPTAVYLIVEVSTSTNDPNSDNDEVFVITPINGKNCGNFSVSGGTEHTCAIVAGNGKPDPNKVDDDLAECWGTNSSGQAGPVVAGTYDQVSAGRAHTCGLKQTGEIACWGSNEDGVVSNAPAGSDFVQVDSGFSHSCAVREDNSVVCWGDNLFGQTTVPGGSFTQVAAGNVHSCGLHTDGTIECWGLDGDLDESGDPIVTGAPTDDDFVQVVAGGEHACGRHQDGTVECWGSDYSGEAADPTGTFEFITAGDEHNCGLRLGSVAECWGDDSSGQVSEVPGDAFTAMDSGAYHTCGLISDGTILCWGDNSSFQSLPPGRSDLCPTCGDNVLEGRETCEACQGLGIPTPCSPVTQFAACCSPVTCTAYRLSENHICRDATGACDAPEVCDGINFSSCPVPGPLRPSTYVCRGAIGSCDPEEKCTGTSNACPANQPFLPSSAPCRILAGSCDVVENCTGTSAECPSDVVVAAATPCRPVAGFCDIAEACTGTAAQCPADLFKANTVPCRGSAGVCDIVENCTGTAAACPSDTLANAAVTCRPSTVICDSQEQCSGTSASCPADTLAQSFVVCRAAVGGCDAVERCTGLTNVCPPDINASPGTVCRTGVTVCDSAEICSGTTKSCPADVFAASTVTCRAAVDACDVAERCTGGSSACPANSFANTSTVCNDGLFCNGVDNCNGSGVCSTHAGDPCPGPDGDSNCAETCNEAADNCTTIDPNNSACEDGEACTDGEKCTGGVCAGGTVTVCDDGDVCTFDTCDDQNGCVYLPGAEQGSCLPSLKGQIQLRNSSDPNEVFLKWSWKKGASFAETLLGTPTVDTEYALCIYDHAGGEAQTVGSFHVPGDGLLWKLKNGRASYKNIDGFPPGGIYQMKVKSSATAGKSGSTLKGAGSTLNLPDMAAGNFYFYHEPSLVVQLRNDAGLCLSTEFVPIDFKKNWENQVKAGYSR